MSYNALTVVLLSIPRPKVRASTESHCRSSDSGVSGVYSGVSGSSVSGSGKWKSCGVGVGGQDWRRQHQVSWRQLILSTLPPHHTRLERQEEDLCRKFERLYQRNKKYERKLNRYNQTLRRGSGHTGSEGFFLIKAVFFCWCWGGNYGG